MNRLLSLLLALVALLASAAPHAERVDGLYEAEVWVSDQGAQNRTTALTLALGEVLAKVSGDAGIANQPLFAEALKTPEPLLEQYRYKPADGGRQVLWAQFDAGEVNALLRRGGATVWGEVRPTVLVWLALEQGGQRKLLSANDSGPLQGALVNSGYRRALPLRLPLLDLTDMAKVNVADVWGGFHDGLMDASRRYQAQVVLVGKLATTASGYQVAWTLRQGDQVVRWERSDAAADKLLQEGVETTALRLAGWFGQASAEAPEGGQVLDQGPRNDGITVNVIGVDSLYSYQRVLRYLGGLPGVGEVTVNRVDGRNLSLMVVAKSGLQHLQRSISLGDVLGPAQPAPGSSVAPGELLFTYLP